jgi:VTC domain
VSVTVTATLDLLAPIALAELDGVASLQTRTDRKYLVNSAQLDAMIDAVAGFARVLDIDGRRSFGYESVYFDTAAYDSYLGSARGRPGRFKVRTRTYVDAAQCWLEVKVRNRRGQTDKHRIRHDPAPRDRLTESSIGFVHTLPGLQQVTFRPTPVLITRYQRSTLEVGRTRATIDVQVACHGPDRRAVGVGDQIVVETKSAGGPGLVDRTLWALRARPVAISKFGIGMAALHPDLPSNKWHRVLQRHVQPLIT